jgi:hypothetical protein
MAINPPSDDHGTAQDEPSSRRRESTPPFRRFSETILEFVQGIGCWRIALMVSAGAFSSAHLPMEG